MKGGLKMYQESGRFYIVDRSDPWEQFFFITSVIFLLSFILILFSGSVISKYQLQIANLQQEKAALENQITVHQKTREFSEQYGINAIKQNPGNALSIAKTVRKFYCKALTEIAYAYNPGLSKEQANIIVNTIYNEAIKYEFDPLEIAAIIALESRFRIDATSSVGAMGLMQLMPGTAAIIAPACGIEFTDNSINDFYDPENNIKMGVAYLSDLRRSYPHSYLIGYNGGPGAIHKVNSGVQFDEVLTYKRIVSSNFFSFKSDYHKKMVTWD
jgi:soluble lytic murein transglycosylase-like protein